MSAPVFLTQEEFAKAAQACAEGLAALESGETLHADASRGLDGMLAVLAAQPFPANDERADPRRETINALLERRRHLP